MEIQVLRASRLNGEPIDPDTVIDVDASLAEVWVKNGRAKIVEKKGPGRPPIQKKDKIETATKEPGERTVKISNLRKIFGNGEKDGIEADNSANNRTGDTSGSEESSQDINQ